MSFDQIANFGNPVTLTASTSTFLNVILLSTWKVLTLSTSGTFTVGSGNTVHITDGVDIFAPNSLVTLVNNTSAAGVLVTTGGSALLPAESTQLDEIHKRLDLDGDQTYNDDGSVITNPDFTLTKSDNGNGTFDIDRT